MIKSVTAHAPVRISFAGGGTDLPEYYLRFGGVVLSAAITRCCSVTVQRNNSSRFHLHSADYDITESFSAESIPPVREPLILAKAALELFAQRCPLEDGLDLRLSSEVTPGTGLGSSSAMTVALIQALGAAFGQSLAAPVLAELASGLEIERLGMPIGKQDQYASAFGGLNLIEFTEKGVSVRKPVLPAGALGALDSRLLLFGTGKNRHSADILRPQREDTGVQPRVTDALHALKDLTSDMVSVLGTGDLDRFGALLHVGWELKKRLSGKISSQAIDRWYDEARRAGALGGKITGAGGGGFLLLYCPLEKQTALREAMLQMGLAELSFRFDPAGARIVAGSDGHDASDRVAMAVGPHLTESHP